MTGIRWLATRLNRFAGDRGGNVAVIFALASVPILFVVGAALDYSGATDLKTRLQRATDATALQMCQLSRTSPRTAPWGARQGAAQSALNGYLGPRPFGIDTLTATASPYRIYLSTRAHFAT